ncbi:hypothetical protein H6775_01245 [Candidatus Nomurabacteria bacterium]|nr:hypothetical protein [Candidatus Nomurabacteria bacterium]
MEDIIRYLHTQPPGKVLELAHIWEFNRDWSLVPRVADWLGMGEWTEWSSETDLSLIQRYDEGEEVCVRVSPEYSGLMREVLSDLPGVNFTITVENLIVGLDARNAGFIRQQGNCWNYQTCRSSLLQKAKEDLAAFTTCGQ